jgi:hypothetical protein
MTTEQDLPHRDDSSKADPNRYYNNHNRNCNEDDDDDEDEGYMDLHTAAAAVHHHTTSPPYSGGEQDSITVLTAAHIQQYPASDHHHHHHGGDGDDDDGTAAVREIHFALLYLLSHPSEFERVLQQDQHHHHHPNSHNPSQQQQPPTSSSSPLAQWNAEYYGGDNDSLQSYTESESIQVGATATQTAASRPHHNDNNNNNNNSSSSSHRGTELLPPVSTSSVPLPYVIFCDDAEIVLPQAHTASQLFGMELWTGMELEAAAGIRPIAQLFLRWLGKTLLPLLFHVSIHRYILVVCLISFSVCLLSSRFHFPPPFYYSNIYIYIYIYSVDARW